MRRWAGFAALLCVACGKSAVPSPFESEDGGTDTDAAEDSGPDAPPPDAGPPDAEPEPILGGSCLEDQQCDDGVDCTFDSCDHTFARCRFDPDHSRCADDVFCNGVELCDPRLGCVGGEPVTCSDGSTCTIDRCVESTRSCEQLPRDADGDGDPDVACRDGGDCNDSDPRVSSLLAEVCSNDQDDDCDGEVDEAVCQLPEHDTCADPLEIDASGTYDVALAAAAGDYAASCAGSGEQWQDVVLALIVEDGPVDADLVATFESGRLALAGVSLCGDASTEIGCSEGAEPPGGGVLARLRLRELPAGNHAVYLFGKSISSATLKVELLPPTPKPTNETCGTAAPLTVGEHIIASVCDAETDLSGACEAETGELVYRFSMAAAQDVHVYATSLDGYGEPTLSLRQPPCSSAQDELVCQTADPAELFWRALPAGTYYLAVSATGPTDVDVVLDVAPPSEAPADESCTDAPLLPPNTTIDVPLAEHVDDIRLECLQGAQDAAYSLELETRSDVRLVQRISSGDTGAVSLALPACASAEDALSCGVSDRSPVRTGVRGLDPGSYRVVAESTHANPTQVAAFVRPAVPPVLVAFADTCSQAVEIAPTGGFFQGNTANVSAHYEAGCDAGGSPEESAPEQMLHLELPSTKRVIFDMEGSGYKTLLDVRRGPDCPGTEVAAGCAAGYHSERSFLDLTLPAGEYFVQVDGYNGAAGPWFLDVFVVDP